MKCWVCGPNKACTHAYPVKRLGLPTLPPAFRDPKEAASVVFRNVERKVEYMEKKGRKSNKGTVAPPPAPVGAPPVAPSAPVEPAKAPAKVKAPESPEDRANALWTASGGSVASEHAIAGLLAGTDGAPAFAKAVLARLRKKNTRVAKRTAAVAA